MLRTIATATAVATPASTYIQMPNRPSRLSSVKSPMLSTI
jgi:hypothetical protein